MIQASSGAVLGVHHVQDSASATGQADLQAEGLLIVVASVVLYRLQGCRDSEATRLARRLEMQDAVGFGDITLADWLEVIRAEDHEIQNPHPLVPEVEDRWGSDLLTVEAFVTLAEVECLKRARRIAYLPAN